MMGRKIAGLLSLTLLFLMTNVVNAQQVITPTQGQVTRTGGNVVAGGSSVNGNFRFTNADSDISGTIPPLGSGAIYTFCNLEGCTIGQTLKIYDNITGRTNLRQGSTPITAGGVTYQKIYYEGQLTFSTGTFRIPYYAGRRSIIRLTYPVKLTGSITGYPSTAFGTPAFVANVNLPGTATITLRRLNPGADSPAYIINDISYNLSATSGN